ncbi:MAG: MipA/OmpV family protein [Halioglobus sp.]|nr:MipA/OmpV family protein [Halioglobus sp.]
MKTIAILKRAAAATALLALLTSRALAADVAVALASPPESGAVVLALFSSANTFGDLRDPDRVEVFTLDGRARYVITDVAPGEYALLVYYDENSNREIDKNFIGIPTEPLGFSNNYRPKGPPSYSSAAFTVAEGDTERLFTVGLYRPLGKLGRLGVGVGAISRSSPYRDYSGGVTQVIPAITYNGDRLQVLGPNIRYGLIGSGTLRLAAAGSYRPGVYEEDDSDYLKGMGDRDSTFTAGLALLAELPMGFDLALGYQHDVLDRTGGGEARIAVDKSFQWGAFRFSPTLGINWLTRDLADYDFGVPQDKATADRPAYRVDAAFTTDAGVGVMYEINTDWLVVMNVAVEFFDDEITDSPIVDDDYVFKGFFALTYVF